MKKMKKLVSVLLTVMMVCGMFSTVFATESEGGVTVPTIKAGGGELGAMIGKIASTILGVLQILAGAIAVGMLIYIGIKYMTKGAGAKAEVKDTLLPFLIGAVLVAGASTLAQIALNMAFN